MAAKKYKDRVYKIIHIRLSEGENKKLRMKAEDLSITIQDFVEGLLAREFSS